MRWKKSLPSTIVHISNGNGGLNTMHGRFQQIIDEAGDTSRASANLSTTNNRENGAIDHR